MQEQEKHAYYTKQQRLVNDLVTSLQHSQKMVEQKEKQAHAALKEAIIKGNANDQIVQKRLSEHYEQKQEELVSLQNSPFFTTLVLEENPKAIHIGKFSYSDGSIYSWVSPIAALRFEDPGSVDYKGTDGWKKHTTIKQKDQVMIQKGKITFLSTETEQRERTLVYQNYFSNRKKTSFVLPDIVAKMEKSQDEVIRAGVKDPLVIAGPAGSGKTTLALHRVAYLLQSPNLAEHFRAREVIVFVQDTSTKHYFSGLLPELGIHDVLITTFAEWALDILDIDATYTTRIGNSEQQRNEYSFAKIQALKNFSSSTQHSPFGLLKEVYQTYFTEDQKALFKKQQELHILDQVDLTILLKSFYQSQGTFTAKREYYQMKKNHSAVKKVGRFPLKYTLMIFDEFQNYLPEQISLAKTTLDSHFEAAMYIGDMNQQTWLGTIQNWEEIQTKIPEKRNITLQSVYRNTKAILRYIQSLGYTIDIDDRLPEGDPVKQLSSDDILKQIEQRLPKDDTEVGIIGMTPESIAQIKTPFEKISHVHVLTARESQGVEFDTVFFIEENKIQETPYVNKELEQQVHQVEQDLRYVALTRAINQLTIFSLPK